MARLNNLSALLIILSLINVLNSSTLKTNGDYVEMENIAGTVSGRFDILGAVLKNEGKKSSLCSKSMEPDNFPADCCGYADLGSERQKRSVGAEKLNSSRPYPWVVFLEYKPGGAACTGALITNSHVLTAAHCIMDTSSKPLSIRLGHQGFEKLTCQTVYGTRTCNDGALSIPIRNISVHEGYDMSNSWIHDIAILHLEEPVAYSEYIQPLCLPSFEVNNDAVPDLQFEFAGWGTSSQRNNLFGFFNIGFGTDFTKVNLPYKSNQECQSLYKSKIESRMRGRRFIIRDTHICAGGVPGQGICAGDSGGPLVWKKDSRYMAVGIASFATLGPCGFEDVPAAFTNIYKYNDWIRDQIRPNGGSIGGLSRSLMVLVLTVYFFT